MQSPVLLSYPRHVHSPQLMRPSLLVQPYPRQSPNGHLSPLMSAVPITSSEINSYHASATTAFQHQSPHTMSIPLSTPPTPALSLTPTVFPPEDINKIHTTTSYSQDPIPELVNSDKGHWAFSLEVPIPAEMAYPTLMSLEYNVKYGTEHGQGTSAVQTSITLTKIPFAGSTPIPIGIIMDPPQEGSSHAAVGLPSQTLNGVPVICLSSVPAVKEYCPTTQREYCVDRQQILPHVRIIEDSRLYLLLDVVEPPSTLMIRSLVVDVSATWVDDTQGKCMLDKIKAAEARVHTAEQKQAKEEQARLQAERKSVEARQATEIAEQMEKAAKKKSEDDRQVKKHDDEQADADRLVKQRADKLAETHMRAKAAADAIAQSHVKAQQEAEIKAGAEHQAELAAEARAQKDRETRSAIEHQL